MLTGCFEGSETRVRFFVMCSQSSTRIALMWSGVGMRISGRLSQASSYGLALVNSRGHSCTHTLSRSSRPRPLRPGAPKLLERSSPSRPSSSSPPRLFVPVVTLLGFLVAASKSRRSVRASSRFSSVGFRIRSLLTQSSQLSHVGQ